MEKSEVAISLEIAQEIQRLEELSNTTKSSITECDSYAVPNKKKQLNIIEIITRRNGKK